MDLNLMKVSRVAGHSGNGKIVVAGPIFAGVATLYTIDSSIEVVS